MRVELAALKKEIASLARGRSAAADAPPTEAQKPAPAAKKAPVRKKAVARKKTAARRPSAGR